MAVQLSAIYKTIKGYTGTLANTSIVIVTSGIQQISTLAIYRCPCVDPSSLDQSCRNVSSYSFACTKDLNRGYGLAFILAPALALFVFSVSASPKFWKVLTGRFHKLSKYKRDDLETSWTLFAIFCQALIAPASWVCIALIDGRYLACAITPLPYDVGPGFKTSNCERLAAQAKPRGSNAFLKSTTFSQIIGAIVIASILLGGFVVYCYARCSFPLTYYHAKYYHLYREMEENEFDDEMRAKAKTAAEKNVRAFLEKRRARELWDRISTVFQFHRNEKNLVVYSPLCKILNETEESVNGEEESVNGEDKEIAMDSLHPDTGTSGHRHATGIETNVTSV